MLSMSTTTTSWNKYCCTWNSGKGVVHWLERQQHGGVKKCEEQITVKVLAFNVVLNHNNGFSAPHLVTVSKHGTYEILVFWDNGKPSLSSWHKVGTFQVPKQLCPDKAEFHLVDGPSVIWTSGSCICSVTGTSMKLTTVNLNSVLPTKNIDSIMKMWCEPEQEPNTSIRLGVQVHLRKASMGEFGDREWYSVKIIMNDAPSVTLVPGPVPGCYGMIATCMTTYSEFVFDHLAGSVRESVRRVIGTELMQVIVIEDGAMDYSVLSLEYIPLKLLTLASSAGHLIVAVMSAKGDVSAHELLDQPDSSDVTDEGRELSKECWTWKRVGEWTRVQDMHAGDFMQTGSSQLLLLLGDSDQFVLTNFSGLTITDGSSSDHQHEAMVEEDMSQSLLDCPASLLNALKGLQLKKHAGEAQLVQYEAMDQQKHQLLAKSHTFMEELAQDSSIIIPPSDPGLLSIVPGVLKESSHVGLSKTTSQKQKNFEVLNVWQKLCDGQWVVGVLAKNVSGRSLARLGMSLIVAEQQLVKDASSRVVWNESFEKSIDIGATLAERELVGAPSQKRRKCDDGTSEEADARIKYGGRHFVNAGDSVCLVVHSAPVLPDGEAVLVVSWTEVAAEGLEVAASEQLVHIKLYTSEVCGGHLDINKSSLQLWIGGRDIKRAGRSLCVQDFSRTDVQSLASLLALHNLTQICVTSKYTYLWRLPSILKAKFPCSPHSIQVSPPLFSQQQKTWRTSAAATPCLVSSPDLGGLGLLGATGLHILIENGSGVISVLHRRSCDSSSLMKLLRDSLPRDMCVCLLADSPSKEHACLHAGLSAIVEEANNMAKDIRDLLVSNEPHCNTMTQQLVTSTNTALTSVHW